MSWHNYFATIPAKQFCMSRDEEKKNAIAGQNKQPVNANDKNVNHREEDQQSYQGELDHVEGRMNNGELGGGMKKEEL